MAEFPDNAADFAASFYPPQPLASIINDHKIPHPDCAQGPPHPSRPPSAKQNYSKCPTPEMLKEQKLLPYLVRPAETKEQTEQAAAHLHGRSTSVTVTPP